MKKVLSKVLAVIIAVMLIVSAMPVAFAAEGDIASGTAGEGIDWVIDADGTLTISGEGAIVTEWNSPPWYDYNDFIINVVIEEGVTEIPSTAFSYAENVVSVSIPSTVVYMSEDSTTPFWSCYSISEINVHADNANYISVDGVVFNKEKTSLLFYPANKEGDSYTIPNTVETVSLYAFGWAKNLREFVIPDTVTTLSPDAFYSADITEITLGAAIKTIPYSCFSSTDLERVIIPDNIEEIGTCAFWGCSYLKTVIIGTGIKSLSDDAFGENDLLSALHYTGTEAQWSEVEILGDGGYMEAFDIHFITEDSYKGATGADCTTDGHTEGKYCELCGEYLTGEVTEYALGHYFENGVCQRENCGYVCIHINDEFDDECDYCEDKLELDFPEIKLGETKTAYIEEAWQKTYVEFVPVATGRYKLFSDNGGDHDNNDPFASVYDSDFEEIGNSDDIVSEAYDYNFLLEFDAVKGKKYYFALSNYNDAVEYTYTLDKSIDIAHQPTSAEPYVDLTWDVDATYQWYTVDISEKEITDQNADAVTYNWGESSYNADNGWSGVLWDEESFGYDFFTVSLDAGETVVVELIGDYTYGVGLYDYNTGTDVGLDVTDALVYELTVEKTGDYTFYAYSDSGNLTVKANLGEFQYTEIEGENTNTLSSATVGEKYACMVGLEDSVLISDNFTCEYAITHQPTEKEPYVELNDGTNAKYQWYSVTEELDEITDEDLSLGDVPPEAVIPTYDAQDGWTGIPMSEETQFFFELALEEGETIKIEANEHAQTIAMFAPAGGFGVEEDFDKNGEAVITVPVDGEYYIIVLGTADTRLKAYKQELSYTKISGETAASLANTKVGTSYACEVTFADGSTEMSDVINRRYSDAHFGQWYSDAVEYVSARKIMTGYANGEFGTSDGIQRQDFIVMLARYAGADLAEYDYDCELSDVADDGYYKAAINWALDEGITTGYENGKFGVGDKMTREQLVTFLYRYAALIGVDTTVQDDVAAQIAAQYADFGKVSSFSKDAIVWALANGVISGQGGVKIDPQGGAQRCQTAQIMYNIYLNDVL